MSICNRTALWFSGPNLQQWVETNPVSLLNGITIQFDISTGCSGPVGGMFAVMFQFSDTSSWSSPTSVIISPSCLNSQSCSSWNYFDPPGSFGAGGFSYGLNQNVYFLSTDYSNGWTHVYIRIPATQGLRRFRFIATINSASPVGWGLSNIYFGETCNGCSGNGHCLSDGSCACDPGYGGSDCLPLDLPPMQLRDTFDSGSASPQWAVIAGGSVQTSVVVAAGGNLYFGGPYTRRLVTAPLNLQLAQYVEFHHL